MGDTLFIPTVAFIPISDLEENVVSKKITQLFLLHT
jgi:hypothetical protein